MCPMKTGTACPSRTPWFFVGSTLLIFFFSVMCFLVCLYSFYVLCSLKHLRLDSSFLIAPTVFPNVYLQLDFLLKLHYRILRLLILLMEIGVCCRYICIDVYCFSLFSFCNLEFIQRNSQTENVLSFAGVLKCDNNCFFEFNMKILYARKDKKKV